MTSPARSSSTVSPTRMSLRATSSMLCSETLRTVTPPTATGSSSATGVSTPVRPTDGRDAEDPRRRLARLELPGHRPAWRARHLPEEPLQLEVVHLDDEAVDLERKVVALGLERGERVGDLVEAAREPMARGRAQAPVGERLQQLLVGLDASALHRARRRGRRARAGATR